MSDLGEGSIIGRIAYSVGYALGRADSIVDQGPELHTQTAAPPRQGYPIRDQNDHDFQVGPSIAITASALAGGWLLSRLIRPRPINWPRAVIAGLAATTLADIAQHLTNTDTSREGGSTFPPTLEDLPRYAAGIATAAAYGAQIYPRLPGSPLTRGLIFGTVEATLADGGGTLGLLQRIAPQLELPLSSVTNYAPANRGPIASLAFGLGLGLYSARPRRK